MHTRSLLEVSQPHSCPQITKMNLTIVISSLALIVSIAAAISQLLQWKRSGFVIKVNLSVAFSEDPSNGQMRTYFIIDATNVGRHPFTIQMWRLQSITSSARIGPGSGVPFHGPHYPHVLEPAGQNAIWFVDYQLAAQHLSREHPGEVHRIQAVLFGAQRKAKSRQTIMIKSDDDWQSMSRHPSYIPEQIRGLRALLRPDRIILYLMSTTNEAAAKNELYIHSKNWIAIRDLKVDLISSNGLNKEARVTGEKFLPPVKYKYVRPRKNLVLATSLDGELPPLPAHEKWRIRVRWRTVIHRNYFSQYMDL